MAIPYQRGLHEIADGVFAYLQPDGSWGLSNAGLIVSKEGSLLVDTFFDLDHTRALLEAAKPFTAIRTVVNTHAHGDHSWGNQLLDGAEILASTACAEELGTTSPELFLNVLANPEAMGKLGTFFATIFGRFRFEGITVTPPTRTFDGELTLNIDGREIRLIEVGPAHSRGDVLVYLPAERVLISGDILFVGGFPVTFTGSIPGWIRALDRVLELDPDVIVPGHGPIAGADEARRLKGYFEYVTREARERFDVGMSPLEAARDMPLHGYADWHNPERVGAVVTALHRELSDGEPPTPIDVLTTMAELAC